MSMKIGRILIVIVEACVTLVKFKAYSAMKDFPQSYTADDERYLSTTGTFKVELNALG